MAERGSDQALDAPEYGLLEIEVFDEERLAALVEWVQETTPTPTTSELSDTR